MAIAGVIQVMMICFPILPLQAGRIASSPTASHRECGLAPDISASPQLPPNISAPRYMYPVINRMLKKSATFREQCKKIGNSRKLRVTLLLVPPNTPHTYRAISRVRRDEERNIWITIELTACTNYFELLGHEFEHAAEQAEGLNLRVLSAQRNSHVYKLDDGSFETDRAVDAGRSVERECSLK